MVSYRELINELIIHAGDVTASQSKVHYTGRDGPIFRFKATPVKCRQSVRHGTMFVHSARGEWCSMGSQ